MSQLIMRIKRMQKIRRIKKIRKLSRKFHHRRNLNVFVLMGMIFCSVLLISIAAVSQSVSAQGSVERTKLVKSIEIQKGDTLWSIASENMTEEYGSITKYIEEIKECNGLTSDCIRAGNNIIVPYYAELPR